MYDPMKDRQIGIPEVIEKWGVPPEKMIDLQALIGDSVDNVPGVPGIGPKTAAQLLEQFGDLDTLLARAGEIKQDKRRETIIDNADKARISRELVTLKNDVPLPEGLDDLVLQPPDGPKLDRLPEDDGVHHADAPRRRGDRHRRRRDRSRPRSWSIPTRHARAGRRRRRATPGNAGRRTASGCAGQRRGAERQGQLRLSGLPARGAQAASGREDRPQALCLHPRSRDARRPGSRGARDRHRRVPHRDHLARPDAGRARRLRAGRRPGKAAYIPLGHRSSAGDLLGGGRGRRPDVGRRGARRAEAAARRPRRSSRSATTSNTTGW